MHWGADATICVFVLRRAFCVKPYRKLFGRRMSHRRVPSTIIVSRAQRLAQGVANHPVIRPRTREQVNERLLYLNTGMYGVVAGGVMAFLPVFLARLGASPTLISWLTSAPALMAVFLLIPGAMVSERQANQVRVRVTFSVFILATYLLCALAPFVVPAAHLPVVLVALWTVRTLADTLALPAWTSVVAAAVSPARRARLNGTRWAIMSLVSAMSSAFFGWLLERVAFPLNYQLVFAISFVLAGLDPLFFSRIRVPHLERPVLESRNVLRRFSEYLSPVMRHRLFLATLGATILYRVALNMPVPLFSLFWVNRLQASDMLIGLRGTVGYGALVVGYTFWGRSANRLGRRKLLYLSCLGLATYPLLTALSPSAIWLLPAALIWGFTLSGVDVGLFELMLSSCPRDRRPLFAAVWNIVANTAIFLGPLLGAALSNVVGLGTALIIAAALQVVGTIPFVTLQEDA